MPLLTFSTLDEFPEGLRKDVKEVKDGDKSTFQLDVVPKVKIDEFRDRNVEQAKKLEEVEARNKAVFGVLGIKPEEFDPAKLEESLTALRTTAQQVADGKLKATGDVDKVVSERTEAMRDKHDRELQARQVELAAAKTEASTHKNNYLRTFIDRAVLEAVRDEELGVQNTAHVDIIDRAYKVFKVSEDGTLTPEKNGQTLWGESGDAAMSVKEWINMALRKESPHYFKPSNGGGASGGGADGKSFGMSDEAFSKLKPEERLKLANRQAAATARR